MSTKYTVFISIEAEDDEGNCIDAGIRGLVNLGEFESEYEAECYIDRVIKEQDNGQN